MNRLALGTLLAGLLLAIPLAGAETVDATVTTDRTVGCQTAPVGASTPPQLRPRLDAETDDCDATVEYDGGNVSCQTSPFAVGPVPALRPYVRAAFDDCHVDVVVLA